MKSESGFTLIEILVAVTITSLLLTTIYGVFTTASEAKQEVEKQAAATHLGRVVFARIGRELLGLSLNESKGQAVLAGGRNDRDEPFLEMLSNEEQGRRAGLSLIRYRLVKGEPNDEESGLWRESSAAYQATEEIAGSRLSGEITDFALRFHDGGTWREEWDSARDGIPKLVEVSLRLRLGEDGLPLHTIYRPVARGLQ